MLVTNSINLARQIVEVGGYFLIEHPEDLGLVAEESPASFWQLDEARQLELETRAATSAIFQCEFDAGSPKLTRFLSNLRRCSALKYATWPRFDSSRRYLGHLPFSCWRRIHPLREKQPVLRQHSSQEHLALCQQS